MKEEYFKTKYEEISELSNTSKCRTVLLKNKDTAELAVKKEMPKEMFDVYSKLANIDGSNLGIVKVLACFVEDEKCVEIEEYVNGKTLESVVSEAKYTDYEGIKYAIDICDTLETLHQMGIIHRDIQPKNVVIENNKAKLIDFDIARNKKEESEKDTRLLGTPEYASPEAYGFSQTDERSDIFSLGKLIEIMVKDDKYNAIIKKCTEIDPENRYQSASELKNDLIKVSKGVQNAQTKSFINTIPGFRQNNIVHKIVAIPIYVIVLFIMAGTGLQAKGNAATKLLSVLLVYIWLLVPYAFLMNIGNVTNHLIKASYKDKKTEWVVRIILCIVSFIITSILFGIFLSTQP